MCQAARMDDMCSWIVPYSWHRGAHESWTLVLQAGIRLHAAQYPHLDGRQDGHDWQHHWRQWRRRRRRRRRQVAQPGAGGDDWRHYRAGAGHDHRRRCGACAGDCDWRRGAAGQGGEAGDGSGGWRGRWWRTGRRRQDLRGGPTSDLLATSCHACVSLQPCAGCAGNPQHRVGNVKTYM